MATTSKKIRKVIETINTMGYNNTQWSVVTKKVNSKQHYGSIIKDETLKPHIAVWFPVEDTVIWVIENRCDNILKNEDGEMIAIYNF